MTLSLNSVSFFHFDTVNFHRFPLLSLARNWRILFVDFMLLLLLLRYFEAFIILLKEGDVITTSSYMNLHLPMLSCGHH